MSKPINIIKRLIKEKDEPVENITELDFSGEKLGSFTPEMKAAIQQCKKLESLVLCECDLTTLKNLPQLKSLQELDLSTNSLPDSEIKHLNIYKSLTFLSLADNKIEKLETIKELKAALPNLIRLECADNPVEHLPNYFKTVFALFPKLESLDNKDKDGNEVETADFAEDDEDDEELEEDDQGNQKPQDGEDSEEDDDAEIDEDYSEGEEQDEEDE